MQGTTNPDVEAVPDPPERCKFCADPMPADWDDQGWHEITKRRTGFATFYCCDPCYWAEVYDGPLEDPHR